MIKTSLLPFFSLEALASSSVTVAVSCEEVESPNCRAPPVLMISHGQGKMGKKFVLAYSDFFVSPKRVRRPPGPWQC